MDLAELRRQVAEMPSISEISAQLEALLGNTPASAVPVDAETSSTATRLPDFSPASVGFTQADSGFGSPPFPIPADDDESDYDGDISGVELLDDSFLESPQEVTLSISGQDGKGCVEPPHVCACLLRELRSADVADSTFPL